MGVTVFDNSELVLTLIDSIGVPVFDNSDVKDTLLQDDADDIAVGDTLIDAV